MPYNTSSHVVEKNRHYLVEMHEKKSSISWPTRKPAVLAYAIREALEACRHHEEYAEWHYLKSCFSVRERPGHVDAIWRKKPRKIKGTTVAEDAVAESQESPTLPELEPLPPLERRLPPLEDIKPNELTLIGIGKQGSDKPLLAIIGAAIYYAHQSGELYFPDAALTDEEKLKLWKWAKTVGWKFIDQEEAGLTLTKRAVDPILLYEPEES